MKNSFKMIAMLGSASIFAVLALLYTNTMPHHPVDDEDDDFTCHIEKPVGSRYVQELRFDKMTRQISGWVIDKTYPCRRVSVNVYINGKLHASALANQFDPVLKLIFVRWANRKYVLAEKVPARLSGLSEIQIQDALTGELIQQGTIQL